MINIGDKARIIGPAGDTDVGRIGTISSQECQMSFIIYDNYNNFRRGDWYSNKYLEVVEKEPMSLIELIEYAAERIKNGASKDQIYLHLCDSGLIKENIVCAIINGIENDGSYRRTKVVRQPI